MDGLYVVYDAVLLRCCLGMMLLLESLHSLHHSWRNHARAVVSWKLATSCRCLLVPMLRMGLWGCGLVNIELVLSTTRRTLCPVLLFPLVVRLHGVHLRCWCHGYWLTRPWHYQMASLVGSWTRTKWNFQFGFQQVIAWRVGLSVSFFSLESWLGRLTPRTAKAQENIRSIECSITID